MKRAKTLKYILLALLIITVLFVINYISNQLYNSSHELTSLRWEERSEILRQYRYEEISARETRALLYANDSYILKCPFCGHEVVPMKYGYASLWEPDSLAYDIQGRIRWISGGCCRRHGDWGCVNCIREYTYKKWLRLDFEWERKRIERIIGRRLSLIEDKVFDFGGDIIDIILSCVSCFRTNQISNSQPVATKEGYGIITENNSPIDTAYHVAVPFVFDKPINGYSVSGSFYPFSSNSETGQVEITFTPLDRGRTLVYSNVGLAEEGHPEWPQKFTGKNIYEYVFNDKFNGYHDGDTLHWHYHTAQPEWIDSPLMYDAEFQFFDVDLYGEDEFLINDYSKCKGGNSYTVYEITPNGFVAKRGTPYKTINNQTRFLSEKRIITVYPDDDTNYYYQYRISDDGEHVLNHERLESYN